MVDARTNYARDISQLVIDTYSNQIGVFQTCIPLSVRAAEISAEGSSIYQYDPKGKAANAYRTLTEEVLIVAKRVGQKIKMTSIDELLCVPSVAGCEEIEVAKIRLFKNHPFKVLDDEKMHELVESIMLNGVLVPVTVRSIEDGDGDYEMISGHRRLFAVKEIGLARIPAIVKNYNDDEAVLSMVDSNLQREEILPSEKAYAYKLKYEAMKRQGKRNDLTSSQLGKKLWADEQLAKDVGESRNQVHRFLRLAEVIPCILDLVDKKVRAVVTAVEISCLESLCEAGFHKSP
jgi:ParB family chromosome partitioning protein